MIRLDAWGREVEPRDHTWDSRPADVEFCDYCDVAQPIDRAASRTTGLRICTFCIEAALADERVRNQP